MLETMMLSFIISNLSNSSLPYNTTFSPNPMNFPNIIMQNFPWFFPLITLFALLITDYVIAAKTQVSTRNLTIGVAFAYTMIAYIEVTGGLTNSVWFFTFEFIFLLALFITQLFATREV